jgi:hypothetical protein
MPDVSPAPPARWPDRLARIWLDRPVHQRAAILHGLSLAVALPLLLWIDRHQWFSGDEWDFLVRRGVIGHRELGLLEPHNEHWSTFPVLVYRALFSLFGVRTYMPYLLVLIVMHLLAAHLLWRLMMRYGVDWLVATGAAAVFMVLGAGWEDLINAFQITFIVPIVLGLLALLIASDHGPFQRRDAWASLVLVLALPFSGVSLTMAIVVALATLLRRGWRPAALIVAAPAAVYLLWYAGWGRHATTVQQEPLSVSLQKAPEFVWRGLVGAVDAVTGLAGVGPVVLVLLTIWVVWANRTPREPWPPVLALFVGAPIFLFLIDIRRSGLGIDAAAAPRYSYAVLALLAPAAALAATALLARRPLRVWLILGATAVLCGVGVSALNTQAQNYAPIKRENEHRIIAAADLVRSDATLLTDQPAPEFSPELSVERLRALARDGDLPGNVQVDEIDRLTAAAFLQVAVGAEAPAGATGEGTIEGTDGARVSAGSSGSCVAVTPRSDDPAVLVSFSEPGTVRVTPSRSGSITTQLQPPDPQSSLRSRARVWPASGGEAHAVSSSATKLWLRLGIPSEGTTRVCNVTSG